MAAALLLPVVWKQASATKAIEASRSSASLVDTPVTKVVQLLEKMKKQVESEAEEDEELYGKMDCWCQTNEKEKTEAIANAEQRLEQLATAIEEGEATSASLSADIKTLQGEIAEDEQALKEATALHAKAKEEFVAFEEDLIESANLLKEAIAALAKPTSGGSLLQTRGGQAQAAAKAMAKAQRLISQASQRAGRAAGAAARVGSVSAPVASFVAHGAHFASAVQRDLWDLMGSLPQGPGAGRVLTGLSQQPMQGAAAGAKSYNARSSSILGILQQMRENMQKNLAESQKEHVLAEIAFQRLRASKEAEIEVAQASVEEKSSTLADVQQKLVQDKEDVVTTRAALEADQKFLVDLRSRCKTAADDYATRRSTRTEEIAAIGEAIAILTSDDARDTLSKSMSLLQLQRRSRARADTAQRRRAKASSLLVAFARRRRGQGGASALELARLAIGVKLDGLETVKGLMAKMIDDLKTQQDDEHEKHEQCKTEIASNEREARSRQSEANEADRQITALEGHLAELKEELAELRTQISDTHVALKRAGEERQAENHEFQQVIADQKATQVVLKQALERLKEFYEKGSFLSYHKGGHEQAKPGEPSSPAPSSGLKYEQNKAAVGVLEMLEKVLQDSHKAQQQAVQEEQASEDAYAELVANTNSMLDALAASVNEKTELQAKAKADLLDARQDLVSANEAMEELHEAGKALHMQCDFILRNYDVRQTARQEEIEAIQQAIGILNGAKM